MPSDFVVIKMPDRITDGRTPAQNLAYETAAQERAANNPTWLLARATKRGQDSRPRLEALGFVVSDVGDELFYEVVQPAGWTKTTNGYWTYVYDEVGQERLMQFFKGASYDCSAFIG